MNLVNGSLRTPSWRSCVDQVSSLPLLARAAPWLFSRPVLRSRAHRHGRHRVVTPGRATTAAATSLGANRAGRAAFHVVGGPILFRRTHLSNDSSEFIAIGRVATTSAHLGLNDVMRQLDLDLLRRKQRHMEKKPIPLRERSLTITLPCGGHGRAECNAGGVWTIDNLASRMTVSRAQARDSTGTGDWYPLPSNRSRSSGGRTTSRSSTVAAVLAAGSACCLPPVSWAASPGGEIMLLIPPPALSSMRASPDRSAPPLCVAKHAWPPWPATHGGRDGGPSTPHTHP